MSWSSSAIFYDSLRGMLSVGMPISRSLELAGEASGQPHRSLSTAWAAGCAQGSSLAAQLRAAGQPALVTSLITAGEQSGKLSEICAEIADYYRHAIQLRRLVVGRLIYPLVLLHVALIVLAVPTVIISGGSPLWFLVGPGAIWLVIIGLFLVFRHNSNLVARLAVAPVCRWVVLPLVAGNTCMVVRAGLNAGMLVPACLELAAGACGNRIQAHRLRDAAAQVFNGTLANLTAAFRTCELPREVVELTANGEVSGRLDETLQQCATLQLERFRERTQWLARLVTGTIYGVGILVAVLVIGRIYAGYMGALSGAAQGVE